MATVENNETIPQLIVSGKWEKAVLEEKPRQKLEENILPAYFKQRRWFGGKARALEQAQIIEVISINKGSSVVYLLFCEIQYTEGQPEVYLLPITLAAGKKAKAILETAPAGVIARLKTTDAEGILYDGVYEKAFQQALLGTISRKQRRKGNQGELIASHGKIFRELMSELALPLESQVLKSEHSNTAILFGEKLFFKLFRRLEEGIHPDLEISAFLTEKTSYANTPKLAGALEYHKVGSEPMVVGLLQTYVPNEGDAWTYTLASIGRYFERVLSPKHEILPPPTFPSALLKLAFEEIPPIAQELIGGIYLERAKLLGKRTAELHLALSANVEDPNFSPEPFSMRYQRSIYQSMQSAARRNLQLLRKNLKNLPEGLKKDAEEILSLEKEIMDRFAVILQKKISAMKIRIHGDYHLGQVLYTGSDFVMIDFEGEPARALSERRLKHSPFRDVAGMIRSFHYAVYTGLFQHPSMRQADIPVLIPWTELWYNYVAAAFLRSYLDTAGDAPFMPKAHDEFDSLLQVFLLEKAIYELGYELNHRPDWLRIPISGIQHLLGASSQPNGQTTVST
ncbi:MAG: putative maltokinase [candidate division KSB1 bacterium]|nr:putative maltokinase [candidate division KSB1 bacterium]